MADKLEIVVARIDENVKSIKKDIEDIKSRCNTEMGDHEKRIRDNEKFKQRGNGALGILAVVVTIVTTIVGWIVIT